jgi:hypothetical protein
MRCLFLAAVFVSCQVAAAQGAGSTHSASDCREGGDFIRNAALSRDGGMSRETFLGRLEDDMVTIRAFPVSLRWFVHSPDDENFLRTEVQAVFDAPDQSERHRDGFMERCARRAGRLEQSRN